MEFPFYLAPGSNLHELIEWKNAMSNKSQDAIENLIRDAISVFGSIEKYTVAETGHCGRCVFTSSDYDEAKGFCDSWKNSADLLDSESMEVLHTNYGSAQ